MYLCRVRALPHAITEPFVVTLESLQDRSLVKENVAVTPSDDTARPGAGAPAHDTRDALTIPVP